MCVSSVLIKAFYRYKLAQRSRTTAEPPVRVQNQRISPIFLHFQIIQKDLIQADYPSKTNEPPVIQKPLLVLGIWCLGWGQESSNNTTSNKTSVIHYHKTSPHPSPTAAESIVFRDTSPNGTISKHVLGSKSTREMRDILYDPAD